MADAPKTSFIPKQNVAKDATPQRKRTFNVFNFLMTVIFLGALILSVGVYLLKTQSEGKLEAKKQELQELRNSFSAGDIESLRELDRRIDVAQVLIDQHLSPTLVFDMLERRTQGLVQFQSFEYQKNESGTVALSMRGVAPRFNTIALQSQEFADDAVLERALFTNLGISFADESTGDGERVIFTVTGKVDTSVIPYTPQLAGTVDDTAETDEAENENVNENENADEAESSGEESPEEEPTDETNTDSGPPMEAVNPDTTEDTL